jgi:opacity protein-like surface antigen
VLCARTAAGQESLIERLQLDKLQIVSLGLSAGRIAPSQVEPTMVYAISADYGEIAPNWRVSFTATYWSSKYRDAVVRGFVDSLNKRLVGPTGTAHLQPSEISLYDVTLGVDVRYMPKYSGELKPFFGIGVAGHVINAEGTLIQGTFVERSLDDIAAGLYVMTGVSFRLFQNIGVEGSVRADILSGFRSSQARVGATYFFGRMWGTAPPVPAK